MLCDYICNSYQKTDRIIFSLSNDATKTGKEIILNEQYKALVGGAPPNHFLKLPVVKNNSAGKEETAKFIEVQTKRFVGEQATEDLA